MRENLIRKLKKVCQLPIIFPCRPETPHRLLSLFKTSVFYHRHDINPSSGGELDPEADNEKERGQKEDTGEGSNDVQPPLEDEGHPPHSSGGEGDDRVALKMVRSRLGEVEIEGVREVPDENALLFAEPGDRGSLIVKRFHWKRDDHLIDHVVPEKGLPSSPFNAPVISRAQP